MTSETTPDGSFLGTASEADGSGKVEAAKERASEVTGTAGTAARDVVREATDQVAAVKDTVATQAHDLLSSAQSEVKGQAQQQTERLSGNLRALAQQAAALSEGRPQEAGPIAGWVDQGRQHLEGWSSRLEAGGLDGLMSDVGSFARRRPLVFLGACTGAGFVIGRFVKAAASAGTSGGGTDAASSPAPRPVARTSDASAAALPPPVEVPPGPATDESGALAAGSGLTGEVVP